MTTELKTLKDFDTLIIPMNQDNCPSVVLGCFKRDLKAEAIKWVKEMNDTERVGLSISRPQELFMNFFNLSEEDLK